MVTAHLCYRPLQTSPLGRARSPQARASRMMIRERIRQGEKDALEAEERARVNQKVMSNKMEEMAQLQNTLITQNQVGGERGRRGGERRWMEREAEGNGKRER